MIRTVYADLVGPGITPFVPSDDPTAAINIVPLAIFVLASITVGVTLLIKLKKQ